MIEQATPAVSAPFITISAPEGHLAMQTNLAPEARPLMLWWLEQTKLMILTQTSQEEQARLVPPTGGMRGFLKKMGKG